MRTDTACTGGMAKEGNFIVITTKIANVLLDPMKCHVLVPEAKIAGQYSVTGRGEA
jgi:hypothetical protein